MFIRMNHQSALVRMRDSCASTMKKLEQLDAKVAKLLAKAEVSVDVPEVRAVLCPCHPL
jgi:hypothetical protein